MKTIEESLKRINESINNIPGETVRKVCLGYVSKNGYIKGGYGYNNRNGSSYRSSPTVEEIYKILNSNDAEEINDNKCSFIEYSNMNNWVRTLQPEGDYAEWLNKCIAIWHKNSYEKSDLSLLASFCGSFNRDVDYNNRQRIKQQKQAEHQAAVNSESNTYNGNVGDKITITLSSAKVLSENVFSYNALSYLWEGKDEEGRTYVWNSDESKSFEAGTTITGTVKKLNEFNNIKQTWLGRVSIVNNEDLNEAEGVKRENGQEAPDWIESPEWEANRKEEHDSQILAANLKKQLTNELNYNKIYDKLIAESKQKCIEEKNKNPDKGSWDADAYYTFEDNDSLKDYNDIIKYTFHVSYHIYDKGEKEDHSDVLLQIDYTINGRSQSPEKMAVKSNDDIFKAAMKTIFSSYDEIKESADENDFDVSEDDEPLDIPEDQYNVIVTDEKSGREFLSDFDTRKKAVDYYNYIVQELKEQQNGLLTVSFENYKYNWDEAEQTSDEYRSYETTEFIDENCIEEDYIEETYSEDELRDLKGKIFNQQKIERISRIKKYDRPELFAKTICTKCGRNKEVLLSNLVHNPDKYGSCICSNKNVDSLVDYATDLYNGTRKLSSNTSGYTGVSFVKSYGGEPYNKWRAYIEVDGQRTYLGDFDLKKDAIKARKEAAEKGIKWYKENRNKLIRNVRRKTKKYKNSKYRDTATKTSVIKKNKK